MTANKMPEMPDVIWAECSRGVRDHIGDYGRACYLAGIAAARECVPEPPEQVDANDRDWCVGYHRCRHETLANLSALEQGVGK